MAETPSPLFTEDEWNLLESALAGYLDELVWPERQAARVEALQAKLKELRRAHG